MISDSELRELAATCRNPAQVRKLRPDLSIPFIVEADQRLNLGLMPKRNASGHTPGRPVPKPGPKPAKGAASK